jgi:uncharacterized protein (DUF433 family)
MPMTAHIIQAFSEEHVERLTGLTKWQLRRWDNAGFFKPRYAYEDRFAPYSRIYSFKDVVGLRTISVLMKEHRASLQSLKCAAEELVRRGYDNWASLKLYVLKRQVYFQKPGSDDAEGLKTGELAMIPVIDVIQDVEDRVENLKKRDPAKIGHVEQHKHIVRNAPVLAGTRIPTATIRRFHEAGYSKDQILREYPTLTGDDIDAALAHEGGLAKSA